MRETQTPAEDDIAPVVLRYPPASLLGDYLRALAGAGLGLGLLVAINTAPLVTAICLGLIAIFGGFGLRTLQRHRARLLLDGAELRFESLARRRIAWSELGRVKLRYFGSRRQRGSGGGFLQLTLEDRKGKRISVESQLEGFDALAWLAARHAKVRSAEIDAISMENLLALGIDPEKPGDAPPPEYPALATFAPPLDSYGTKR